ncbi:DnaJ domain-containing protein [Methylocaldum sp. MU1018]
MIQLILLITLIILAAATVRRFLDSAPSTAPARKFRRGLIWTGILALLFLAATGRLGWLVPLIGALVAALLRLAPVLVRLLIQYAPLLRRWQQRRTATRQTASDAGRNSSFVESRFLRMQLDHMTGEIMGDVLTGLYAGRSLRDLTLEQLNELYGDYVRHDPDSASLLKAYAERVHGASWQSHESRSAGFDHGKMTADEAYRVLGIASGCSRETIVDAHRRLMQKLHPDRGGSDYLAAKINQAKDILLGR